MRGIAILAKTTTGKRRGNNMLLFLSMMIICVVIYLTYSRQQSYPERTSFESTRDKLKYLAGMAVYIAHKDFNIDLTYTPASIKQVDDILGKLHKRYLKEKRGKEEGYKVEGTNGLAFAFGAYIGEVIIHNHRGARWSKDNPDTGKNDYSVHWKAGVSFPVSWCYKKIVNGSEDNVWHKYVMTKNLSGKFKNGNEQ